MPEVKLDECPVCRKATTPAETQPDRARDIIHFNCPRCGRFRCSEEAMVFNEGLPRLSSVDRVRLSGVIREQSGVSVERPLILHGDIDSLLSTAPSQFDIATKVRKLLSAVARRTTQPGESVTLPHETSYPLAYSTNDQEFIYLMSYAESMGWLKRAGTLREFGLQLTPAGWEETQRRPRIESAQGFVAMWFSPEMTDAYTNGLKAAIEDDCHYRCHRIDAVEYNGDIVDEIMAEIRESRFVVCDLTGHRNGVYFEAGFAMGLDIPTIWTCREDHAGKTHFDAEHFNQIRWATPDELRKKLATRIRATIGLGPITPAKN